MNINYHTSEKIINTIDDFTAIKNNSKRLDHYTFQNIDLSNVDMKWDEYYLSSTTFLGCKINQKDIITLIEKGALIIPDFNDQPYNPYRHKLYTWQELEYKGDEGITTDFKIYQNFSKTRFNPSINESLWQRIHDHAIDNALRSLLIPNSSGGYIKNIVGFMGGHSTLRTDEFFRKTAFTAKAISEKGYFVASGGGPGIMEATNLGAYFSGQSDHSLNDALEMLSNSPHYTDPGYIEKAREVLLKYPEGQESLAIPTWFYGHEPSNLFASHIAKYFSNSIREDTLLAICLHGIVYAPGSAGTTQEIFMDAAQNHYGTFEYISPMVFLGKERYEMDTMLFPTLKQLAKGKQYKKLLYLADEPEAVVRFILKHPPQKV